MSIPFLILAAVLVTSIQRIIYKYWGLKNVEYTRFFNLPYVFEGENVQLIEVISNQKLLPVLWLRLESRIDSGLKFQRRDNLDIKHQKYNKSFFSLMPYTKITRRHDVNCIKRGYFPLKSAVLSCNDAFNMIQLSEELELSSSITVYPKILSINEIGLPSHSWMGDVVVRRWIVDDPFMISGVREYRYGDPMNRINWNSTARTGQLQVYNTDHTANIKLMILLNIETDEHIWDSSEDTGHIEKGISYCASIANYTIPKGIETGFGCNGCLIDMPVQPVFIPSRCSYEHMNELFDTMARIILKRSLYFHIFLDDILNNGIKNTDFLIITPFINEHIDERIRKIRELGNSVEVLNLFKS